MKLSVEILMRLGEVIPLLLDQDREGHQAAALRVALLPSHHSAKVTAI
jgi:hypothetical protein